jgi:hypothetical protein
LSAKADRLAADVVAAVLERTGVQKSAGQVSLLFAVASPLCEAIVDRDRALKRAGKAAKKYARQARQVNRTLRAIAYPDRAPAPPSRLVPFNPPDWKVGLAPAAEPARNGHPYRGVVTDE